jgi:squalene synthase HpnC
VFIALKETIEEFDIPSKPFEDLISAFEQDCRITRYDTFSDLLGYCERSANPVGRLFLWIFGYTDVERQCLSDQICTALQLANFWQDIGPDYARGRVYIPREDLEMFGCSESDIAERRSTQEFAELMQFQIDRTEGMFNAGSALPAMVNQRLGVDIELFRRAGLAVLAKIRRNGYNTLDYRPTLSKVEKVRLLVECVLGRM